MTLSISSFLYFSPLLSNKIITTIIHIPSFKQRYNQYKKNPQTNFRFWFISFTLWKHWFNSLTIWNQSLNFFLWYTSYNLTKYVDVCVYINSTKTAIQVIFILVLISVFYFLLKDFRFKVYKSQFSQDKDFYDSTLSLSFLFPVLVFFFTFKFISKKMSKYFITK